MEYLVLALLYVAGSAVYALATYLFVRRPRTIGTLRIDQSDPDGPYMFLEVEKGNMQTIMSKKLVSLKVSLQDYPTRK